MNESAGVTDFAEILSRDDVRRVSSKVLENAFDALETGEFYCEKMKRLGSSADYETRWRAVAALHGTIEDIRFFTGYGFEMYAGSMEFGWQEIDSIRAAYLRRARAVARGLAPVIREAIPRAYWRAFGKKTHERLEARRMARAA